MDTWFQNWNPPSSLLPDHQSQFHSPIHMRNFSNEFPQYTHHRRKIQTHPDTYLPYIFSLGLLKGTQSDTQRDIKTSTPTGTHSNIYSGTKSGARSGYRSAAHPGTPKNRTRHKPLETSGPFKTWYHWTMLDYAYPTESERTRAIAFEEFIPEHNLPLGLEVYQNRLFITTPKWKPGIPATLSILPKTPKQPSPKLVPYPNWEWHHTESCKGMTSVFRVQADTCGRLWVLDSGQIDITIKPQQVCHPKILIFDLTTDQLLVRYELPAAFIKEDSLYSNILVDIRDGDCQNVHAYLTDVWRYGLVVFSLEKMRSWRVTDHLFFPDPLAAAYKVHHLNFEWTDGIFGLTLSPNLKGSPKDRILYFHPMSSFREFHVKTSVICNETGWAGVKDAFKVIGQSRGKAGHVSASGMDRNGVMFYNLVTRDSVGCWDSRKPYRRENLGLVAKDSERMVFPNDLKIDMEVRQSVWIITNGLPFYLYEGLDKKRVNFRVMSAFNDEAVRGGVCDPAVQLFGKSMEEYVNDEDCY